MVLEEKRKDLESTRQRAIVDRVLAKLSELDPNLYYMPTIELAAEVQRYIRESGNLSNDDLKLVEHLKRRDIQIMLGVHH